MFHLYFPFPKLRTNYVSTIMAVNFLYIFLISFTYEYITLVLGKLEIFIVYEMKCGSLGFFEWKMDG